MDTLPVVLDGGPTRLLVDELGHPIWPVATPLEMDLLCATAGRLGSAVRVVASPAAHPEPARRGGGVVASLEPALWSEGRLYAHLTGRAFLALDDARQLPETEDLEVVVCSSEAISSTLLHRMYDRVRPVSPGLVYGGTPAELRAQVLRASAVAQLRTRPEGMYVQVRPELGTGSEDERAWVTRAIALDASVLAVLTHSDGLDAPLAKGVDRGNLLICPIRDAPGAAPAVPIAPHRTPECRHSGRCHRVRMPVDEAFARGELIEPRAFRARVLIWSTCYGAMDRGAPLDRQWSVVHQFHMNPHLDVVLTKWQAAYGHGPFSELVQGLAGGAAVGQVVAAFNATAGILERGAQFAIFGDPRVAAPFRDAHPGMETFYGTSRPAGGARDEGHPPSMPRTTEALPDGPVPHHVALLRQCIKTPLRYRDEERDADAARQRFEQAYAELGGDSASNGDRDRRLADLQSATLECFRRYCDVIQGWAPRVRLQKFWVGAPCAHCGALKTEAIHAFGTSCGPRRIGTCPRCQIVEDSPVELELDFRVLDDHQLELVGEIPPGRFAGLIVLWSTTPMMGAVRSWPVASDGRPVRRVALEVAWPRATARVTVWMMFDLQYLTLNHRVQGQA